MLGIFSQSRTTRLERGAVRAAVPHVGSAVSMLRPGRCGAIVPAVRPATRIFNEDLIFFSADAHQALTIAGHDSARSSCWFVSISEP